MNSNSKPVPARPMKVLRKLSLKFALGLLVGLGCIVILYCLILPAKPFVYVGF